MTSLTALDELDRPHLTADDIHGADAAVSAPLEVFRFVRVGRGKDSVWGNPFTHIPTGTLAKFVVPYDQVLAEYEGYVRGRLDLMQRLGTLRGKTLGCFCKPRACHGDVLVKLVEEAFRNG